MDQPNRSCEWCNPNMSSRTRLANRSPMFYARETRADADTAKVLTMDEARRIGSNIAKLPTLLKPKVG